MPTADRAAAPAGRPAGAGTEPDAGATSGMSTGVPPTASTAEAPADTATGCPVCGAAVTEEGGPAECPDCRWPLRAGPVLGPLTEELLRAFGERLATARRRYDLTAAARAAGHPWHGDDVLYARLQGLVRDGPPRPGEAAEALRGPWREEAPARTLREAVEAYLREAQLRETHLREAHLREATGAVAVEVAAFEIAADGLTAVGFARADDGDLYERAETTSWPWASLLPALPADPDHARFLLAGGIGERPPPDFATTPALARALPDPPRPGTAPPVLACGLPGWPVPERVLTVLRRRHPDAVAVRIPPDPGRPPRQVLRHAPGISALTCGPGPEPATAHLAVGCPDGSAAVWVPGAAEPLAARALHTGRVTALDLAPSLRALVTGGSDGAVRLWSFGGSGRSRALAWHEGWVNAVRLRAGAVFSLGDDGLLRRSDPSRLLGAPDGTVYPLKVGWSAATALEVTSDGRTVAVGGATGVGLWDAVSGHRLGRLATGASVTGLALDAADRLLAVGCADGRVHVHDLRTRAAPDELTGHTGAVRQLAFGPRGLLAACDESGAIRVRPADRARPVPRGTAVGLHTAAVRGLAATPAGHLLSASADGLVRAWRLPDPL
ncbi:hypothetical protein SMD11_6389 [Streptomyces albireticuli]|uniref:Uncharacterized protein n=1 Tax=Streptomyces albireticuli TaxID=1940 RepID=A0A1Z2LCE8_9ACTN|nr:hypothetical protein [Streptomyces albireticuli]ARZ71965.1 hypothetical protein SMD11_6389 [Streptomyces albireticuli]